MSVVKASSVDACGPPRLASSAGIPVDIAQSPEIDAATAALPSNYNFEVKKTLWKLRAARAQRVALQLPEGLLIYACVLADIMSRFASVDVVILGDVTYGACCVDDLGAVALGCDFLVHYGHSCLVPISDMAAGLRVLYVFVDIAFDTSHLGDALRAYFPAATRLALAGTIQFAGALGAVRAALGDHFASLAVPQAKPLSPGEVLGCTAPDLSLSPGGAPDALIFVADGRFHLEAIMIKNPEVVAFRYDPYSKVLSRERYDTGGMLDERRNAISCAVAATDAGATWGVILGTLGRQGSPRVLDALLAALARRGATAFVLLLSEISPQKLAVFGDTVSAWVQVACPRLSIDWGAGFSRAPLLTPYEAYVALGEVAWREKYPMDYYQKGSGPWTNYGS